MGAAIAYNSLFALVPLAIAFTAMLTFVGRSGEVLEDLYASINENLPPDLAEFLIGIFQQSVEWVQNERGVILFVSILIALWSGSRAVYAVQKALRAVEGVEDDRGYIRSRLLGIGVTVAAGIGVLAAYTLLLLSGRVWTRVTDSLGLGGATAARAFAVGLAIVFVWLLLWAIYRWGPPRPISHAGAIAAGVGALLVLGSLVALALFPNLESSVASLLGVIGVFLVWLYYVGIVVVAAPTAIAALVGATRNQLRR